MIRKLAVAVSFFAALLLSAAPLTAAGESGGKKAKPKKKEEDVAAHVTQGALKVERPDGTYAECPLKHTDVKAKISGFIARVNVTQTFVNPTKKKIEAVYVFPLPHKSAVDSMNMLIGDRRIVGVIKKRSVAELIYQQAIAAGQTAAVLHQERPNIFTQKVGNIPPGGTVKIQISYVDVLEYDMGVYSFHFPMVVGPRYNPAGWTDGVGAVPAGKGGASSQPVEVQYTDRPAHDISLSLELDAGVPIQNFKSVNHEVNLQQTGESKAVCSIKAADKIPNKDFELRYGVVGKKPEMAVLAHQDSGRDGYFMLMVQPSEDKKMLEAPPREITFLVDVSGSMSGAPTAQVKLALKHFLKQVSPRDRIQLITFAGTPYNVFPKPMPATAENIKKLADYSKSYRSGGGTEMLTAIKAALNDELKGDMVRIVVMLSDGYIGNEKQIIEEVGKRCGDKIRFWCLGIGSSVNRFLIDGVAKQGGGMSKVLSINEKEDEVQTLVGQIMYRIQRAQLAGINIDWGRLNVYETYPARVPELWAGRPVIVYGRYTGGGEARIRISGEAEGRPVSWPLNVTLPIKESANDVLSTVWARKKIESLMDQVWVDGSPAMVEEVTKIALEHKLMSQYTSFVAVDTESGPADGEPVEPPVRMPVPVPMPQGVSWTGVFGGEVPAEGRRAGLALAEEKLLKCADAAKMPSVATLAPPAPPPPAMNRPASWGRRKEQAAGMYPMMLHGKKGGKYAYAPGGPVRTRSGLGFRGPGGGIAGGRGAYPAKPMPTIATEYAERDRALRYDSKAREVAGYVYYGRREKLAQNVKQAATRAEELFAAAEKEEDLGLRRALMQRLYLYASSWGVAGPQTHAAGQKALAAIAEVDRQLSQKSLEQEPGLKARLKGLVIREKLLADALAEVAAAAGVKLDLVPGAIAAAGRMQGRRTLEVTFMDLRGATAAQAFDWLCAPAHLNWTASAGKVRVNAAILTGVPAPWTYDVSALALPQADELKGAKDWNKKNRLASELTDRFLTAVREAAGVEAPEDCFWLDAGQMVVHGKASVHAAVNRLLSEFKAGSGDHGELGKRVLERYKARKESLEKAVEARERAEVYGALYWSSWTLLAAAAAGESDLEALTRLQAAWKDPFAAKLAAGEAPVTAVRSAWAVSESAVVRAKDAELKDLAASLLGKIGPSADKALATLKASCQKGKVDVSAYAAVLYSVLAFRNGNALGVVDDKRLSSFEKEALACMFPKDSKKDGADQLRSIARVLVLGADKAGGGELVKLFESGMNGDDLNALAALAAKKQGGKTWLAFRTSAAANFSRMGVSGSVVLIANRLSKSALPSAK